MTIKLASIICTICGFKDKALSYDIVSMAYSYKYYLQRQACPTIVGIYLNEVLGYSRNENSIIDNLRDEMLRDKKTFDYLYPIFQSRDAKRILTLLNTIDDISMVEYKELINPNHKSFVSLVSKEKLLKDKIDKSSLELDSRFGL
ncbi:hypothetical protein TSMG0086 [Halocynthia phage JM-2012]|uniref:hypothetical protein n=1 Tax=Halocynthia phage JM-2012 TaxID=1173297 RepID=UPI00025C692A|nr:hypothetical protein TSMG0086 [Halocynthia phage JM-2012]AFI55369.1 hypothetical protein TSMG0086 [Halocynthia phage JM-2012]